MKMTSVVKCEGKNIDIFKKEDVNMKFWTVLNWVMDNKGPEFTMSQNEFDKRYRVSPRSFKKQMDIMLGEGILKKNNDEYIRNFEPLNKFDFDFIKDFDTVTHGARYELRLLVYLRSAYKPGDIVFESQIDLVASIGYRTVSNLNTINMGKSLRSLEEKGIIELGRFDYNGREKRGFKILK